jgi:hypothetical protein
MFQCPLYYEYILPHTTSTYCRMVMRKCCSCDGLADKPSPGSTRTRRIRQHAATLSTPRPGPRWRQSVKGYYDRATRRETIVQVDNHNWLKAPLIGSSVHLLGPDFDFHNPPP